MRDRQVQLFVAVFLPKEWEQKLKKYQNAFPRIPGLRWVEPENLRMTLLFIGLTKESKIPQIKLALEKISRRTDPFEITFDRFAFAPPNKEQTMIWAQFTNTHEFGFLAKDIKKVVTRITTLEEDRKPGIPHITMARFKNAKLPSHIDVKMKDTTLQVAGFKLVSSQLSKRGSRFKVIGDYKLEKKDVQK